LRKFFVPYLHWCDTGPSLLTKLSHQRADLRSAICPRPYFHFCDYRQWRTIFSKTPLPEDAYVIHFSAGGPTSRRVSTGTTSERRSLAPVSPGDTFHLPQRMAIIANQPALLRISAKPAGAQRTWYRKRALGHEVHVLAGATTPPPSPRRHDGVRCIGERPMRCSHSSPAPLFGCATASRTARST
jgi:hypothetical protein